MINRKKGNLGWICGFFWTICVFSAPVCAQNQVVSPQVEEMMEKAIAQMNNGDYDKANLTFRNILRQKSVMPTEMSYLFAETLYMINQYENSKNFLDKYLRLAGATGRYYPQALDLKRYLDDAFEEILSCNLCDNRGYQLEPCEKCQQTGVLADECYYCQSTGVNLCKVCNGRGVTTSLNAFSELQYFTCQNCEGKGQVACKICLGNKIITETCPDCLGSHKKAGFQICDHVPDKDPNN